MNGKVDIFIQKKSGSKVLASYVRGQYFGEVELFHDSKSVASVRAGEHGTRIGIIDKKIFLEILKQSPKMRQALHKEADLRLKSNIRARKKT